MWPGKLFFLGTEGEEAKELCNIPLLGVSVRRRSISSCNGLLCIAPHDDSESPIVVYNPITKEHLVLPEAEDGDGFDNEVGIGFDPSTNKYKVARIYHLTMNGNERHGFCEIITLGEENSWRKIDVPFEEIEEAMSRLQPPLAGRAFALTEGASLLWHYKLQSRRETSTAGENDTKTEASNGIVQNLPQEIVEEILSRLPIESIMTCRRVCKSWCKAIKDPSFVNLQLKRSRDQPPSYVLQDTGRRFIRRWSQSGGKLFFLGTTEGEKAKELCNIPLLGGSVTRRSISSCNGLLCIAPTDEDDESETPPIVVCNPITKEHTVLPKPEDIGQYGFENQVGIGFDPSTNKYKVARIYYLAMNDNESHCFCEIITLGEKNSWRKIDLPFEVLPLESGGAVFWEGALHWICSSEKEERISGYIFMKVCILRLDMSKEEFHLIPTASLSLGYDKYQLLELAGSLILEGLVWGHPTINLLQLKRSMTGEIRVVRYFVFGRNRLVEDAPYYCTLSVPWKQFSKIIDEDEEEWNVPNCKLLSVVSNEKDWKIWPNKFMFWFPGEERYAYQQVRGIPKSFIPSSFRPTLVSIQPTP
ncbi:hypothetical protein Tsubulata_032456 [Turnera subulata]|uniref:F-box domain-containing protein n=1 Tax=Turnera subulata TaxID=218843 RepID=A0A9Q0J269_9ROSI|nr:hypothetical protein Tsubulata_032456 [Turnera subulata]